MTSWPFVLLLAATALSQQPEPKPVPADSVEVFATGCFKGRAFTATAPREEAGVQRGPNVNGRTFRVAGPKDVMKEVKAHNGHLVEVTGIVRKAALAEPPGTRVGNTRITVGGANQIGGRNGMPIANVAVMDLTAVRFVSDACPIR